MKNKVKQFLKEYHVNEISENDLVEILRKQGYTTIYFERGLEDKDVAEVVTNLNLYNYVMTQNAFTYANAKYHIVFVNKALTQQERITVLAHEEGHIYLGHMNSSGIVHGPVSEELEANEFVHYLLHRRKLTNWFLRNKKMIIAIGLAITLTGIGYGAYSIISYNMMPYANYYITESGNKYHQKECIFVKDKKNVHRMKKEEFESGEYERCKICLP